MKFDIIIGNPPFQEKKIHNNKSKPIWNLFVINNFKYLKENGYLSLIHPPGWRVPFGNYSEILELYKNKKMIYLSLQNNTKSKKIFNVDVDIDYFLLQNSEIIRKFQTKIIFNDNSYEYINLKESIIIPYFKNFPLEIFEHNVKKRVKILYSRTLYGTDKKHINKEYNNIYKYPCINYIKSNDKLILYYSNIKKDFFVPKVVFGTGRGGVYIDEDGRYGLTQFAFGIVDDPKNFNNIKMALKSKKFINLMKFDSYNRYNWKFISLMKRDFWKYFI